MNMTLGNFVMNLQNLWNQETIIFLGINDSGWCVIMEHNFEQLTVTRRMNNPRISLLDLWSLIRLKSPDLPTSADDSLYCQFNHSTYNLAILRVLKACYSDSYYKYTLTPKPWHVHIIHKSDSFSFVLYWPIKVTTSLLCTTRTKHHNGIIKLASQIWLTK